MKKVIVYLLVLVLLINTSISADFYNTKETTMDLSIKGEIDIHETQTNYNIDYIKTTLFFLPEETVRQKIISSNIEPDALKEEDSIIFRWNNIANNKLVFKTDYTINTNNIFTKIKKKNTFPITDLPEEYIPYTKPTENIDSGNEEIITLASSIAEGEDDLYIIVNKIAEWIETNIEYDLNTLTADVSQKASWVLLNRFGVCDELTNLFLAMMRSVGIPARFVSGVAYTDWNNINGWGPHAWAEVYFPEYGWIPFDITYKQFSHIDSSHIKLRHSLDSDKPSTKYEWKAHGVLVDPKELDMDVTLINTVPSREQYISLKTDIYEEDTGFGSYNLVEVDVKNLNDYYTYTEIYLSSAREVEVVGSKEKKVVLKPYEEKKEYWMIKVKDDLDKKYSYTLPVGIVSLRNLSSVVYFTASYDEIEYSRSDIQDILDQKQEQKEKVYSSNIALTCNLEKNQYYIDETITFNCLVKNTGNTVLDNLNLCLKEECENFDLGISQEFEKNFSLENPSIGKKESIIAISNRDISQVSRIKYEVKDKPVVKIAKLEYPAELSYDDLFNIKFTVSKASITKPENVSVIFEGPEMKRSWTIKTLTTDQDFMIDILAKDLDAGKNSFTVLVEYQDKEGSRFITKEDFYIDLTNLNIIQRIMIFIRNIF